MEKDTSVILRMSSDDKNLLSVKSILLGIKQSELIRQGAWAWWPGGEPDADKLLKTYQDSSPEDKAVIVDLIFRYYRLRGYPHHCLSPSELNKGMATIATTPSPLLDDNNLQINSIGLPVANSFHPHMMTVRCREGYLSPYECFANDERFKDAINRWMELGNKPNIAGLRRILRTRDGVRSVVNFKPAIAKYFYDTYCPDGGRVLDPCAGYGGRLAGLIASNRGLQYHGIDPCGDTVVGNTKMAAFFAKQNDLGGRLWNFGFRMDLGCAEDVMSKLADCSYDLVFTSPPFFDVEKYDDDPSQSYIRYPTYEKWVDGFLWPLLSRSWGVLVYGGCLIINIKNYRKMMIADDVLRLMKERLQQQPVKIYHMRLANSEYHRVEGKPMFHTEPIFVFQKQPTHTQLL